MTDAAAVAPLTPPAPASELILTPPAPVAAVAPEKVGGMVALNQAALPGLDQKVTAYVGSIMALDPHSPAFTAKASDVSSLGDADIRQAADTSNRLLNNPVKAMGKDKQMGGAKVASTLIELRRTVEDLDPKQAIGVRKILGMIPFGDKFKDYFQKYESVQTHLDAIVKALYDSQDELRKDNAALEQEKVHLWDTMQRLAQYIYIAEHLDTGLSARIEQLNTTDPERAKALKEDVLYYVRQKRQDLLTQLAVSIQGYLAMDLVRKNNIELIKGVDRATTTTIAALRTAVIIAQALANQKLVLDQIDALNTTTSNLLEANSQLLLTQGVAIQKLAADSSIGIDKLQAAFANVYQAMDATDAFRMQALDAMATTITALTAETTKAQSYLARVRNSDANTEAGNLRLGPTDSAAR